MEYTSRISNKLREMESGFKELLPSKLNGFIIKGQAKLTLDQAKHLHFYILTRGLEADKMVEALNRLDQTDALVEQILGDRAKLEHHANRGHAHSNSHAQANPMEAQTISSAESNHYHNQKTSSDTESDQLDSDGQWKVRQHGAFVIHHKALGIRQTDQSCHHEVWLHLDLVEWRSEQSHHERHDRRILLKDRSSPCHYGKQKEHISDVMSDHSLSS